MYDLKNPCISDDNINVAGHRLSTGAMEEVIATHPDVAECAVIGINDSLKGEIPLGFVVLKSSSQKKEKQINEELVEMIRNSIGAVAFYKKTHVLRNLPKTRSGKILRRVLRHIAHERTLENLKIPPTIEDASVLHEILETIKAEHHKGN